MWYKVVFQNTRIACRAREPNVSQDIPVSRATSAPNQYARYEASSRKQSCSPLSVHWLIPFILFSHFYTAQDCAR